MSDVHKLCPSDSPFAFPYNFFIRSLIVSRLQHVHHALRGQGLDQDKAGEVEILSSYRWLRIPAETTPRFWISWTIRRFKGVKYPRSLHTNSQTASGLNWSTLIWTRDRLLPRSPDTSYPLRTMPQGSWAALLTWSMIIPPSTTKRAKGVYGDCGWSKYLADAFVNHAYNQERNVFMSMEATHVSA